VQSRERVERCGSLAETSIGYGQASIDPCRTGLLLQRLSFEERGLFITTGIEVSAADSDQTIRAGWTPVEAGGLAKMPDGCLWLAGKRVKPAAAFPGPGGSIPDESGSGQDTRRLAGVEHPADTRACTIAWRGRPESTCARPRRYAILMKVREASNESVFGARLVGE
jgi:hypothetical protein